MKGHRYGRTLPKHSLCSRTGKKRWPDHGSAVAVLHRAANLRSAAAALGFATRRGEVRAYRCESCSGWHTTSHSEVVLGERQTWRT